MTETSGNIYIAPAAMGLGDLAVTLPVVQTLIARGNPVYLVVRLLEHLPLASRIPDLAGVILEWQLESRLRANDVFYNLRDHYLQRRFWWGSREFVQAHPQMRINDVLRLICEDLGVPADFDMLRKLNVNPRPDVRNGIILIPGSAVNAKEWDADRWLTLAGELCQRRVPVGVIGEPERSRTVAALVASGARHFPTPTIGDALDIISASAAVISVDTGLMHLAVHQGTPTIGIFRPNPVYIRPLPHFRALVAAGNCAEPCYRLEDQCAHHHIGQAGPSFRPQDWSCQSLYGDRCLDKVALSAVLDTLQELVPAVQPVY
jgi:Glycosyltransferase family 9 (heptosyltransferase)